MTDIEILQDIIKDFQRTIDKTKKLPKTKKRLAHIKDLESRISYRKDKIRTLEIEREIEGIKEVNKQWI